MKRRLNLLLLGVMTSLLVLCFSIVQFSNNNTATAATGIFHQINFQGKLVNPDGTNVTDGTYSIVFSIYNVSSAGSAIWTETQSTVSLSNGLFQVNLGSVTSLPGSIDFNTDNIYLGVKVGADAEMTPRIQFTAVPQAFNSEKLGGLDKTGYIQNNTTQQASSNFNISNTGIAGVSFQSPLFDTPAGTTTLNVGTTNATAGIALNQSTTIAANKSLTLSSGTGVFSQTYVSGAASSAHSIAITNNNAGAGVAVQGINLTPTNTTAPSSLTNTLNVVNFAAGGALGGSDTTNGLNFASATGYTNFLNTPTAVLTSAGVLSGLTGLTVASGNATISTGNLTVTTGTATVQGANALTVGLTGTNTGAVLFKGSTAASGTLTVIGQANPTNNTLTLPNETGTFCTTAMTACSTAGSGFIQNQSSTPGSAQTGNFNITGTGIAATALQTALLDTPSGTTTLNVGTTNATAGIALNQSTTIAANKSLTLSSGTGVFSQTYVSGAASSAHSIAITNNNAGAGVAVQGINLTPTNTTAPSSLTNTLNVVNFAAGGALGGSDTTNGLNFASATGYTNFLNTPTAVLTSAGVLSGLTGLTVASGNATISTGNLTVTTGTATVQGANALTVGLTGTNTGAVLFKGSTAASGTLTVIGQANPTNNTLTLPNETGTFCTTAMTACSTAGSGFIQNQSSTPGSAQTGNFNITGTGIAATALQTALLDTPSGTTTLNVGTTNATAGINLNQNTVVKGDKSFLIDYTSTGNAAAFQVNKAVGTAAFTIDTSGTAARVTIGNVGTCSGTNSGSLCIATTNSGTFTGQAVNLNNTTTLTNTGSGATSYGNKMYLNDTGSATNTSYGVWFDSTGTTNASNTVTSFYALNKTTNPGSLIQLQAKPAGTAVTVFNVSNTGAITATNQTDSTAAFQVQNAAATANLLTVDSTNSGAITVAGVAPATSTTAGTNASTILTVTGPAGGISTGLGFTAGNGAAISLTAGAGGAQSGASGANFGGAGGAIALQGGVGGAATNGTGGASSAVTISTQAGGNATAGTGGAGGTIALQGGAGGTGTTAGGAGSNVNITAGNGGNGTTIGGAGGIITLAGGNVGTGGAPTAGYVLVKNAANSTSGFQIQNAAATTLLNYDTTNQQLSVRNKTDSSSTGGNLVTSQDFTSANWSGCNGGAGGWSGTVTNTTHNTGNFTTCSATGTNFTVTAGATYKISFTIAGNSSAYNTVGVSIGGVFGSSVSNNGSNTVIITASTSGALTFNPSLNFNGTISSVSVNKITNNSSTLSIKDSSNTVQLEIRAVSSSTGVGYQSLFSNSTGAYNTALGYQSLQSNLSGLSNTSLGYQSLQFSASGNNNNAIGYQSMQYNVSGTDNTSIGYQSLLYNAIGGSNVAIGNYSLLTNVNGSSNVAIGNNSLGTNTTGSYNSAFGYQAGNQSSVAGFKTLGTLQQATAIGVFSQVYANNTLALGGQGVDAVKVGIGTGLPTNTLSVEPFQYTLNTVSVTNGSGTVTGSGTFFTQAMVGSPIYIASNDQYIAPYVGTITGYTSATVITVSPTVSLTTGSYNYYINYTGLQVDTTGKVGIGTSSPSAFLHLTGYSPADAAGIGTAATSVLNVTGPTGGLSTSTGSLPAGAGSAISLTSGAGGVQTGASGANTGGASGALTLQTSTGGNATSGTGGAGGTIALQGGTGGTGTTAGGAGSNVNITAGNGGNGTTIGGAGGIITLSGGNVGTGGSPTAGYVKVKNAANSTTAFQVQNIAGNALLTVDSSSATKSVTIGQANGGVTTALSLANTTSANLVSIQAAAASATYALTLPSAAPSTSQCLLTGAVTATLLTFGSCGSATLQSAYDAGNTITTTDARNISFTLANTTTDSNFLVNIATGSTSKFAVQNNGSDVLSVNSAGTLTGTGPVGGIGVSYSGAPLNVSSQAFLQIGNTIVGGNSGTNGGTWFGINAGATTGTAADFLNFQNQNSVKLKVDASGNITSGSITGTGPVGSPGIGISMTGAPQQSAIQSFLQIGGSIAGGNSVTNGGTWFGINAGATTGTAADFLNFQNQNSVKLKVDASGNITSGSITGTGPVGSPGIGISMTGAPQQSGSQSFLQIGNSISGGNSVTNGGTWFGINAGATTGTAADFLNFQNQNSVKLKVDASGNITSGSITGTGPVGSPGIGISMTGAPQNSSIQSFLQIGNSISGGNSVTNGGTWFGINAGATTGTVADFLNFQNQNVVKLKVDASGNLTAGAALFQNFTDSNTAFLIKQSSAAGGTTFLTVDTTNSGAFTLAGVAPAPVSTAGTAASNILTVTGPAGGATTSILNHTAGAGSAITLTTGAGGAATGVSGAQVGGAGGLLTLQGGVGGAATSGTGGAGSSVLIKAGNGGNGSTTGGAGGIITLTGGSVGTGGTPTAGYVLVKNATDSASGFQIQNAAATTLLNYDTSNQQLSLRNKTDAASLGGELASGTSCSGTNWSGTGPWTHSTGNTTALSCTVPASVTNGATYQVIFTVASNTTATNTVTANLGSTNTPAVGANATHTFVVTTTGTAGLTITPTTNFNGSVNSISIIQITNNTNTLAVKNSSNTTVLEVRATSTNLGLGYQTLQSNTTGTNNTGVGYQSLQSNTTGSNNTALGYQSLQSNTTGSNSVAIGSSALKANTTGTNNVAIGYQVLQNSTTGLSNVGIGYLALSGNMTGNNNAALGYQSLSGNTTGGNNLALGYQSLNSNTTGSFNTAIGNYAGNADSTGAFFTLNNLQQATAIGTYSQVYANNTLALGGQGADAVKVGIGTGLPTNPLSVEKYRYSTGTVNTTSGSAAIVGVGTTFASTMVGNAIYIASNSTSVAPYSGIIASYTDPTHITVDTNVGFTSSGASYYINYVGLQVGNFGHVGINTNTPSYDLAFSGYNNAVMRVEAQPTLNTDGTTLTVRGATGNGSGNGGSSTFTGGYGGATGNGGAAIIQGGAGGNTSGSGGALTLTGGTATTSGAGGDVTISGGAGVGTNQNGGNISLTTGVSTGSGIDGTIIAKPGTGSDTNDFFQVQNAAGEVMLAVNTLGETGNFISDGSVEGSWPGNWSTFGTGVTISQSATFAYSGNYSAKVVTTGSANSGIQYAVPALTATTTYILSFEAELGSGTWTDLDVGFGWAGTTPGTQSCKASQTVVTGGFTYLTSGSSGCVYTPTGTPGATGYIYIKQAAGASRTFYIDALHMVTGTNIGAYYAGSIDVSGVVFTGSMNIQPTVQDSTSLLQVQSLNGTGLLDVDSLNQRVGIGLTKPLAELHVGSINSADDLVLFKSSGATRTGNFLQVVGSANTYMLIDGNGQTQFKPTYTVASATSAAWNGLYVPATTATVTGTTAITTATGFDLVHLAQPTITDSSAVTITNAATLFIDGAPIAGGSVTLTNSAGIWNNGFTRTGLVGTGGTGAVCSSLGAGTAPTNGVSYLLQDCSGAPAADYAESYPIAAGATYGDIVSVGSKMVNTYDSAADGNTDWTKIKGQITQLVKTNSPYQDNTIGIISDNNGDFTSAGHNIKDADNPMPVALNGRVPVNIASSSDPIAPGDYLTTSSVPGKAMKATGAGHVIGKALAAWDPSSGETSIMVYVEPGYYNGPSSTNYIQNGGDATLNTLTANTGNFSDINVTAYANIHNLTVQTLQVSGDLNVAGNLTVQGLATVVDLMVNGHILTGGNAPNLSVMAAAGSHNAVANIDGNDTSGTITITTGDATNAGAGITGPSLGDLIKLNFNKAFGKSPRVIITGNDAASAGLVVYPAGTTADSFNLAISGQPAPNTTYSFTYFVVQ